MIWIIWLAIGPVGKGDVSLIDPVEGGEVVLDCAQPNGQPDISKFD